MPIEKVKFKDNEPRRTVAASWTNLEKRLEAEAGVWREGEILFLDNLRTIKLRETATEMHVLAELTAKAKCPHCSTESNFKKNGLTEAYMINDLPVRFKRVSIYYRAQRYSCFKCNQTFQQSFDDCNNTHRMTNRLYAYIEKKSFSIYTTFSELARETGIHEHVIRNIFTKRSIELKNNRVIILPSWIAIDEVYPASRKYKRLVISDPVNGKILDILGEDSQEKIKEWFAGARNRENVRVVSMDMHLPYKAAIEDALPDAEIVVDRYHAQKLVNNALRETLKIISCSLTVSEQKEKMRDLRLLQKNRHALKPEEKKIVDRWFLQMPELDRSYKLKEDFAGIFQLSDMENARKHFSIWLEKVAEFDRYFNQKYKKQIRRPRKEPFAGILISMKEHWFNEILNYVKYKTEFSIKVTNAFAEYANNQIKKGFRRGNGYHFTVLRDKVVFGDFLVEKFVPHPLKSATKRGRRTWTKKPVVSKESNVNRSIKAGEDNNVFIQQRIKKNSMGNKAFQKRMGHMIEKLPFENQYNPPGEPRSVELQESCPKISIKRRESKKFSAEKRVESNPEQTPLFKMDTGIEAVDSTPLISETEPFMQQSLFG